MHTAHSNVCKSTPARAGSMLINIILALHFGQAGRSNGADGTADERRWDWVMVLPFAKRREHNTLSHQYCPGHGPAMGKYMPQGTQPRVNSGLLAPIAVQEVYTAAGDTPPAAEALTAMSSGERGRLGWRRQSSQTTSPHWHRNRRNVLPLRESSMSMKKRSTQAHLVQTTWPLPLASLPKRSFRLARSIVLPGCASAPSRQGRSDCYPSSDSARYPMLIFDQIRTLARGQIATRKRPQRRQ